MVCLILFSIFAATEKLSTLFGISSDTPSKAFLDTLTTDATRMSSNLRLMPGGTSISGKMSTLRKTYTDGPSSTDGPSLTDGPSPTDGPSSTDGPTSIDETTIVATQTQHRVTCSTPCECLWNYTDPSDNKHDRKTYLPYKVDKTTLSSYRGRRQCARDYRKSAIYLGCGGITVLVLFPLFIVMLDFLPSPRQLRQRH